MQLYQWYTTVRFHIKTQENSVKHHVMSSARNAVALLASFFGLCLCISAQMPCISDCDPLVVPFGQTETRTFVVDQCTLTVAYQTRLCQGVYDLNILAVTRQGNCPVTNVSEQIDLAIRLMIGSNAMNLPIGESGSTWRIAKPACWQIEANEPIAPCVSVCCVSILRVRQTTGCDTWHFTGETFNKIKPACNVPMRSSMSNPEFPSVQCIFVCEPQLRP